MSSNTRRILLHPDSRRYHFQTKVFTQSHLDYLVEHSDVQTPVEMAKHMGFSMQTAYKYMKIYGIDRIVKKRRSGPRYIKDRNKIASILEDFVNSKDTMQSVADRHSVAIETVSSYVSKYWLTKRLEESTEIIVVQSKV